MTAKRKFYYCGNYLETIFPNSSLNAWKAPSDQRIKEIFPGAAIFLLFRQNLSTSAMMPAFKNYEIMDVPVVQWQPEANAKVDVPAQQRIMSWLNVLSLSRI